MTTVPTVADAPVTAPASDGSDDLTAELRALLPAPVQERARATVRAICDAAVAILDESGEDGFSVEEIRRRSGATTGSIYHHFGDAGRLLAIARALRFRRSMASAIDVAVARYASVTDAAQLVRMTRAQVVGRDQPEARAAVWVLSDALASARDIPELAAAVSAAFRAATSRLEEVFLAMQQRGLIPPDVDPRSMLLSSRMLSHARLLDDLDPRPVPHLDWVAVSCRFHDGLLDARPVEALDPAVRRSTERLRALIRPTDVTGDGGGSPGVEGDADADPRVAAVVARARELLVVGGVAAVQVGRIRSELGLSAGWFHRAVGDRDALLDAARLDLLDRSLSAEVRSFAALVQHARSPEELVDAVVDWIADPPRDPMSARLRWQRTDLLVAARLRPGLGHEAGLVIGRLTDAMTEVVVEAQARGLLRPDLAPRAVARFAHATVYGAMLIELDGRPVDVATWRHTLRRGLRPLTH